MTVDCMACLVAMTTGIPCEILGKDSDGITHAVANIRSSENAYGQLEACVIMRVFDEIRQAPS